MSRSPGRIALTLGMIALIVVMEARWREPRPVGVPLAEQAAASLFHILSAVEPQAVKSRASRADIHDLATRYGVLAGRLGDRGETARRARLAQAALMALVGEQGKAADCLDRVEPSRKDRRVQFLIQGLRGTAAASDLTWDELVSPESNLRWLTLVRAAAEESGKSELVSRADELRLRRAIHLWPGVLLVIVMLGAGVVGVVVLVRLLLGHRRPVCTWLGPRPSYSIHDAIDFVLLWVVCQVPVGLAAAPMLGRGTDSGLVGAEFLTYLGGLLLAAIVAKYTFFAGKRVVASTLGWWGSVPLREVGIGILGYCPILVCMAVAGYLNARVLPGREQALAAVVTSIESPIWIAAFFLLAAVGAPVVEESLFRGLLFSVVRRRLSLAATAALTSLVFAVPHGAPGQLLPIWVVGVGLAVIRERCGSIVPCMVAHACVNTVSLFGLLSLKAIAAA